MLGESGVQLTRWIKETSELLTPAPASVPGPLERCAERTRADSFFCSPAELPVDQGRVSVRQPLVGVSARGHLDHDRPYPSSDRGLVWTSIEKRTLRRDTGWKNGCTRCFSTCR